MPEAPPVAQKPTPPPVAPAAPAAAEPQKEAKQARAYSLKFEPDKDFNETTLFLKGSVTGKVWISAAVPVSLRSLTGEEVDKINEAVTVKDGMSLQAYQTDLTYWNLAFSVTAIGSEPFSGTTEEKLAKLRKMATAVLTRMALAYLEFNSRVSELFDGKEATEVAKKS
jgi:hypothetical protein